MAKISKREYYDLLVSTSATGGFPARNSLGCVYLHSSGRKCAIGLLIPDGHKAQYEGGYVDLILDIFPDLKDYMPDGLTVTELREIQRCHDSQVNGWDHEKFVESLQPCFKDVLA